MKYYVVDELLASHSSAIAERLESMKLGAGMDGLYWLPVPSAMLEEIQAAHTEKCGPYAMALELEEHSLRLELLVRARNALRCECIGYASAPLRAHMIHYLDTLLEELGIQV